MNKTTNTTSSMEGLIFYRETVAVLFILAIQVCIYRFSTCLIIIAKAIQNYQSFRDNKMFIPFFILLFVGNMLLGVADVYLGYHASRQTYSGAVINVVNLMAVVGIICIDTFFGLIPNLFYSVYKTDLDKAEDEITNRYFIANIFIVCFFFLVVFVLNFIEGQQFSYLTNILVIVELAYTTIFYLLAIRAMGRLNNPKMKKTLTKFFSTFVFYAIVQVARAISIAYNLGTTPSPTNKGTLWNAVILTDVMNAILLVTVVLFLKDMKIRRKGDKATKSNSDANKTSTLDSVKVPDE